MMIGVNTNVMMSVKSGNAALPTPRPLANHLFGGDMVVKKCSTCGIVKPVADFWKLVANKDGLQCRCKLCAKDATRKYFAAHPDARADNERRFKEVHPDAARISSRKMRAKTPERCAARMKANNAIRDGRLIPEPCFCCGVKAEAHHVSYASDMWLHVTWLCRAHHKQLHREANYEHRDNSDRGTRAYIDRGAANVGA